LLIQGDMKTIKFYVFAVITALLFFTACQNEDITSTSPELKSVTLTGSSSSSQVASITLYAGKTINVGSLVISETDTNGDGISDALSAIYSTTGNWSLKEVHLWIGTSLASMPQTKTGNPQIGQFPYSFSNLSGNTYNVIIPFSSINYNSCQASYLIAAHAVVSNGSSTETAWATGTQMNIKGSWATYANITIVDNNPPVITGTLPSVTVEGCSTSSAPTALTSVSALESAGLAISDNRTTDDNLIVSASDVSTGECPIEIIRTYTILDACGNSSTVKQNITIEDTTAPVLSGQGANTTITAPALPEFTAPVATDECTQVPSVTYSDVTVVNANSTVVTRTWTATDACGNSSSVSQVITVNNQPSTPNNPDSPAECTSWQTETGFGGNASGNGNAWWYYYTGNGVQTIWAGQSINAGTVELKNGYLYITLTNGWQLQDVSESVKIQGYNSLPSSRPVAGQFTTYKGTSLTVPVNAYSYYVVHLDLQKCSSYSSNN